MSLIANCLTTLLQIDLKNNPYRLRMSHFFAGLIDLAKICSLIIPAMGSYFWIRRNIWSSARSIFDLSRTKYGFSSSLINELCGQKADSFVALLYIVSGTFVQAVLFLIPVERPFASPLRLNFLNLFFAIGTFFISKHIGNLFSRWFERRLIAEVELIIEQVKANKTSTT